MIRPLLQKSRPDLPVSKNFVLGISIQDLGPTAFTVVGCLADAIFVKHVAENYLHAKLPAFCRAVWSRRAAYGRQEHVRFGSARCHAFAVREMISFCRRQSTDGLWINRADTAFPVRRSHPGWKIRCNPSSPVVLLADSLGNDADPASPDTFTENPWALVREFMDAHGDLLRRQERITLNKALANRTHCAILDDVLAVARRFVD